jgi:polygalacturonase
LTKTRRYFLRQAGLATAAMALWSRRAFGGIAEYDVRKFGAVGDGVAVDTAAIQRATQRRSAVEGGCYCREPNDFSLGLFC